MSHIDKKDNKESKNLNKEIKKDLSKVSVEAAKEIGISTESRKSRKK